MSTSMERLKTIQRHVIGRNQSCSGENIQPHKVSSSRDTGKIATIPSSQGEHQATGVMYCMENAVAVSNNSHAECIKNYDFDSQVCKYYFSLVPVSKEVTSMLCVSICLLP